MNYYELKDFKSIESSDLISAFKNGKTITIGCISVFEDSIGKPGDRFVSLKGVFYENDYLVFEFDNDENVIIEKPSHIVVNDKVIGVNSCESIKWNTKELSLFYQKKAEDLITETIQGEHFFRTKENASAMLFYTW